MNWLSRTEKLTGPDALAYLRGRHVLIVGLGGVGGYAFEMLVRAGIGSFTLVDGDRFDATNLNRQLLALTDTVGREKVEAARSRAEKINPQIFLRLFFERYDSASRDRILDRQYDYCCDCIDSAADKTDLIVSCIEREIPIVSAMGAGNRLRPKFRVADIYDTAYDGLARTMRKRLREAGVERLKTVCDEGSPSQGEGTPGSISYAPALMGCLMAQEAIGDLLCRR